MRDKLIVALDVPSAQHALNIVDRLDTSVEIYKVGKELFTAAGPAFVQALIACKGKKVMLDLKYHDIPNTVYRSVIAAAELGISFLTIHASGGAEMISAAVAGAQYGSRPTVLAVTVLTSLKDEDLVELGYQTGVQAQVLRLASIALDAGAQGIVASALEAPLLRKYGSSFRLVTPGIRLNDNNTHDQVRVATPDYAIKSGADYLVAGRSITGADDPQAAAETFVTLMEKGRDELSNLC